MTKHELTKTLDFDLNIKSGDTSVLDDATSKARLVYNKTLDQYFNTSKNYETIREDLPNEVNLITNSVQLIADKTYDSIQNYYEYEDYNRPQQKDDWFPLRSNHGEGYNLTLEDNKINFRISAVPYGDKVRGTLHGSNEHITLVKQALQNDNWRVGTSEVVKQNGDWQLHVNVTHKTAEVTAPTETRTLIGVDVNESNIALAALTEDKGVIDSIVLEYDEVKRKRHEHFTIRKRLQSNGKLGQVEQIGSQEERFVTDALHKLTRKAVEWASQFENPCIVLEDLKDMRDSIDYGAQMNRRLHALPFGKIHEYITYKANFESIPVVKANPEYTSQECLNCGHSSRSNRHKLRFKCVECEWQDHSDRKASVSIAERGIEEIELDWIVPPLNKLPVVRTTRGCDGLASGGVKPPTTTPTTA
jgi:IS605 OrfB family transposase